MTLLMNMEDTYVSLTHEEHEVAKCLYLTFQKKPVWYVFKFGAQGQGYWNTELFISQV